MVISASTLTTRNILTDINKTHPLSNSFKFSASWSLALAPTMSSLALILFYLAMTQKSHREKVLTPTMMHIRVSLNNTHLSFSLKCLLILSNNPLILPIRREHNVRNRDPLCIFNSKSSGRTLVASLHI